MRKVTVKESGIRVQSAKRSAAKEGSAVVNTSATSELPARQSRCAAEDRDEPLAQGHAPPTEEQAREEVLAEQFFSEPPDSLRPMELWDEPQNKPTQSPGSRRAMFATFSILGVFLVGIGSYTVYSRIIMPTPVELGRAAKLEEPPASPQPRTEEKPSEEALSALSALPAQALRESSPSEIVAPAQAPRESSSSEIVAPESPEPQAEEADIAPAEHQAATPLSGKLLQVPTLNRMAFRERSLGGPQLAQGHQPTSIEPSGSSNPSTQRAEALQPNSPSVGEPRRNDTTAATTSQRLASGSRPVRYRDIVRRANALYRKRSTRGLAIEEYERAVSVNPRGVEALLKLAYHNLNLSKYRTAELFATRAVKVSPSNARGWFLLGAARDALGDRKGALEAYERCAQAKGPYAAPCKLLYGSRG